MKRLYLFEIVRIVVLITENEIVSKMRWICADQQENLAKAAIERELTIILNFKIDVSLIRFLVIISYYKFWILDSLFWIVGITSLCPFKTDRMP